MHIPLIRTLTLGLLIAVLAACSGVDAPTAEEGLETSQVGPFSGTETRSGIFLEFGGQEAVLPNGVCFFKEPDFGGPIGIRDFGGEVLCFTSEDPVPEGVRYRFRTIRPSWNDEISSLIVAPGYEVITYTDSNFRGRGARAGDANGFARVGQVQFNNAISSFEIVRTD